MRRRLLLVAVFLLAGAVVNVAVAWGLAAFLNVFEPGFTEGTLVTAPSATVPDQYWGVKRFERAGGVRILSSWTVRPPIASTRSSFWQVGDPRSLGLRDERYTPGESRVVNPPHPQSLVPKWTDLQRPPHDSVRDVNLHRQLDGRGWPMITLWCELPIAAHFSTNRHLYLPSEARGAIEFADWPWEWGVFRYPRALPVLPLWRGLVVNTIFYAAVLWLLICGPFMLRRFIRRRRGLCPGCGYPLGDSNVCTECGMALPGRTEAIT